MALLERVEKDMVEAMKARDEARLNALRMLKSALKKQQIDSMKALDEAAELQVLNTLLKQRREAAEMFRKGGREAQAQKEEAELKLLESYMPPAATDEEMAQAVEAALAETGATSAKQMSAVIAVAKSKLAGQRVDGKLLSEKVKARLS